MKRLALFAVAVAVLSVAPAASAVSIIKHPDPPKYTVEIEPHLNVALFGFDYRGTTGFGPGVRFSIPIVSPGFIKKINNSVAISFGADFIWYGGGSAICDGGRNGACYDAPRFWAAYFPVAMQWNFWLTDKWSVFGEPGLSTRHAFGNEGFCDTRFAQCRTKTTLHPAFFAGGRFHFSDRVALTFRLGYPTALSVGLSIF